jgi:DNA-binding NarL/FixJ family response regulator
MHVPKERKSGSYCRPTILAVHDGNEETPLMSEASAGLLSVRERQILRLIMNGRSRKEVAFDLQLAHSTVRVLYSRAMRKLGQGGREAPAYA